jgi:hypothetical protein
MNQITPSVAKNIFWRNLFFCGFIVPIFVFTSCHRNGSPDSAVVFGKIVTASGVDSSNAPTALADTFSPQQKTIYVVAEAKEVAPGTHLSANWSRDGQPVQVSNEVVAAEGYNDTNIEFHMNPGAGGWLPGNYKVQIVVNGNPGPEASFLIK